MASKRGRSSPDATDRRRHHRRDYRRRLEIVGGAALGTALRREGASRSGESSNSEEPKWQLSCRQKQITNGDGFQRLRVVESMEADSAHESWPRRHTARQEETSDARRCSHIIDVVLFSKRSHGGSANRTRHEFTHTVRAVATASVSSPGLF